MTVIQRYNSVIPESIGRKMSIQGLKRYFGNKIHAVIMMAPLKGNDTPRHMHPYGDYSEYHLVYRR